MLLSQPKIKGLEELPAYTKYFFTDDYPLDPKARDKIMGKGDPKARLSELREAVKAADFSSDAALEQMLTALASARGLGVGDYIHPGRLAVSGTNVGPTFYGLFRVLGRARVEARLERFLSTL
jgi:glutamyl-tRNA synthetase